MTTFITVEGGVAAAARAPARSRCGASSAGIDESALRLGDVYELSNGSVFMRIGGNQNVCLRRRGNRSVWSAAGNRGGHTKPVVRVYNRVTLRLED